MSFSPASDGGRSVACLSDPSPQLEGAGVGGYGTVNKTNGPGGVQGVYVSGSAPTTADNTSGSASSRLLDEQTHGDDPLTLYTVSNSAISEGDPYQHMILNLGMRDLQSGLIGDTGLERVYSPDGIIPWYDFVKAPGIDVYIEATMPLLYPDESLLFGRGLLCTPRRMNSNMTKDPSLGVVPVLRDGTEIADMNARARLLAWVRLNLLRRYGRRHVSVMSDLHIGPSIVVLWMLLPLIILLGLGLSISGVPSHKMEYVFGGCAILGLGIPVLVGIWMWVSQPLHKARLTEEWAWNLSRNQLIPQSQSHLLVIGEDCLCDDDFENEKNNLLFAASEVIT